MVRYAKRMLREAKSGELQGMAGVVIYDDGCTDDFWVMAPRTYNVRLLSDRMVGAIERLKHQLLDIRLGMEREDDG